ncbi:MAG: HAD family hydrolase [Propioniciclava sp.]
MIDQHLSPIHTLIYDFGGVITAPLITGILRLSQVVERDLELIAAAMSEPVSGQELGPLALLEVGGLTERDAVALFCDRLDLNPDQLHGEQTFGQMWLSTLGIESETLAQAHQYKQAGIRLGLATNNVAEWRSIWQQLVGPDLFDFIVDSSELGVRKPSLEFYLEVIRASQGVQGVLVLDDEPDNIRAAQASGFETLLWGPDPARSRRDLARRLS